MSVKRAASTQYRVDWSVHSAENDTTATTWAKDTIQIILLQEIRDHLAALRALLECRNTLDIPVRLRSIDRRLRTLEKSRAPVD